ncbi:MAG: phosphate ABC transporter permease PstA [Calditrichae bacterium]|nr:phosphate ABC transporter permease PstA [Calditrichia bacterium]
MVAWIIIIILVKGLGFFWPGDVLQVKLQNGDSYMGELWDEHLDKETLVEETQIKIGNRDVYGRDFIWLKNNEIASRSYPENAVTFERMEYGNFYGFIKAAYLDDKIVQPGDGETLKDVVFDVHDQAMDTKEQINDLQEEATEIMAPLAEVQREMTLLQLAGAEETATGKQQFDELQKKADELDKEISPQIEKINAQLTTLVLRDRASYLEVETADGTTKHIELSSIVRFFYPNEMGAVSKSIHYAGKLWEFVADNPRESNTEGGVFPAIFGTVLMVLLMSIAVVPFGVLAAIYLNEYAKQGAIIRFIRLSVNNLAGVPSIVFGVFGLGFFVYAVGGSIDQLFFSSKLPEPTFGTGGILWASLTLALLTLPVVVVATEEGILAVPRANKEGALALGSTKWQMIRKIVLPNAMPGILTGLILAISRGAGEVAPLMITGVVKLAPTLALDGSFPFLHLDRKFMHLGFHIYDVGFQSPNVEAAKPMVYSTALLLIIIVVLLNLFAIYIRNNLRKKYKTSTF